MLVVPGARIPQLLIERAEQRDMFGHTHLCSQLRWIAPGPLLDEGGPKGV